MSKVDINRLEEEENRFQKKRDKKRKIRNNCTKNSKAILTSEIRVP